MNPKISIIVPVFKVESYLHKCLESILGQTFKDFELILIDDGSPDNSGKICDEYAQKDSRIKVIHKSNEGLSAARNTGIDIAKGEYIGFVDSDDYVEEDMFKILYQNAVTYNADVVECGINIVTKDEKKPVGNHGEIEIGNNVFALRQLLQQGFRISAWNKLYKREIFCDLRYPNKLYEDGLFFKIKTYVFIGQSLYNYVQRRDSIMDQQKRYTLKNLDGLESNEQRFYFLKEKLNDTSVIELAEYYFFQGILIEYRNLIQHDELDQLYKYRDLIRLKIVKNFNVFFSNRMLIHYKNLIRSSRLKISIFNRLFIYNHHYINNLYQIKNYNIQKVTRGTLP